MGAIFDCFRGSKNEQSPRQAGSVITPDTDTRRQAAANAAQSRLTQNENRGVDENALRQMKQRQNELQRREEQQARQNIGDNGGLRWQVS